MKVLQPQTQRPGRRQVWSVRWSKELPGVQILALLRGLQRLFQRGPSVIQVNERFRVAATASPPNPCLANPPGTRHRQPLPVGGHCHPTVPDNLTNNQLSLSTGDVTTMTFLAPSSITYVSQVQTDLAARRGGGRAEVYDPPDSRVAANR